METWAGLVWARAVRLLMRWAMLAFGLAVGAGAASAFASTAGPWVVDSDVTPPTVTITSGPPAVTNSRSATFTMVSDEPGTFRCSKDGAPLYKCVTPFEWNWLTDGEHTFATQAIDLAGNRSSVATWVWTVDTVVPVVAISEGPPAHTNATSATLVFSLDDPSAITGCSLDAGPFEPCTGSVTYTGLAEGAHSATVAAVDPAGNVGLAVHRWTVDLTSPTVTIWSGPPPFSNQSSATFTFSGSGHHHFSCSLDGGPAETCTSPATYAGLADGGHTFQVTAVDRAGNESAPAGRMWLQDTRAPSIEVTGPGPYHNSRSVTFELTSDEAGASFKCSKDGAPFYSCLTPFTWSWASEGPHTFAAFAYDPAGNQSDPQTIAFTVDTIPPDVAITGSPANPTTATTATFEFTSTDPAASYSCTLDAWAAEPCASPTTYTGLSTGPHTFMVAAVDPAGNSSARSYPWEVTDETILPQGGSWFGVYLGSSVKLAPTRDLELAAFERQIGRKVAMERVFYAWRDRWPNVFDLASRDQGRLLFVSWHAPLRGTETPWADIAQGKHDATIDARAAEVKEFGAPVYLSFNHEPDMEPHLGTPEEFVAAYRRVRDRFVAQGATNVSFALTLTGAAYRSGLANAYYPGDEYVDVLAADGYNHYGCLHLGFGHRWNSFRNIFGGFYDYGIEKGKPMMIPEYGSGEDPLRPGRKAEWIREAHEALEGWPQVKATMYYNHQSDPLCSYLLDSSAAAFDAFVSMGADPDFNPPPPLVFLSSAPEAHDRSTSPTFVFESNIPGTTFACSLDDAPSEPCQSPVQLSGLGDGPHALRIVATDPAGNSNASVHEWTVDTVAPVVSFSSGPPPVTNRTDVSVKVEVSEESTTATCALDGAPHADCEGWVEFTGLADGVHTFSVTATDLAGNVSDPGIRTWIVDTRAPSITVTGGPPPLTNSRTATFELTSDDPAATFRCSKEGGPFYRCLSPFTMNWLSDGVHTFAAIAVDPAGNESPPSPTHTWTVDATAPVTTITSGPPEVTMSATAVFEFAADEPGVAFHCSLDDGPFEPCTSPATYTVTVGSHRFSVMAVDRAGNVGPATSRTWSRVA